MIYFILAFLIYLFIGHKLYTVAYKLDKKNITPIKFTYFETLIFWFIFMFHYLTRNDEINYPFLKQNRHDRRVETKIHQAYFNEKVRKITRILNIKPEFSKMDLNTNDISDNGLKYIMATWVNEYAHLCLIMYGQNTIKFFLGISRYKLPNQPNKESNIEMLESFDDKQFITDSMILKTTRLFKQQSRVFK